MTINDDSAWLASERDLGREPYVVGDRYVVTAVPGERTLTVDEAYRHDTDPAARYATGSAPFGPPWLVRIPTSLVILSGELPKLASRPDEHVDHPRP